MTTRPAVHAQLMAMMAILLTMTVRPLVAQQPNVDFTITGTSTIRGWTCTAKGIMAVTPGPGGGAAVPGFGNGVKTAKLVVPVKAFTCPNAEMTEHLMQAMKPEQYPEIVYAVEKYEVTGTKAQAIGTMTIQAKSQPVTVPVTLAPSGAGVSLQGETKLDMTAYGVEPPVVMLGMLKVGPQIRIEFKGVVTP